MLDVGLKLEVGIVALFGSACDKNYNFDSSENPAGPLQLKPRYRILGVKQDFGIHRTIPYWDLYSVPPVYRNHQVSGSKSWAFSEDRASLLALSCAAVRGLGTLSPKP